MLRVRAAGPEDRAFIHTALPRLFEHRPGWRSTSEMVSGTARVLDSALEEARDDEFFVIVEADGEPIGFAYAVTQCDFFTTEPHAHLSEIVVTREGEGAGRALMAAVEEWAFARGDRYVSLNVLDGNMRASEFYLRGGYEIETRKLIKRKAR